MTYDEVAHHNTPDDAWVIVDGEEGQGNVYDVTSFAPSHPGGAKYIHKYAGKVATKEFLTNHPLDIIRRTLPAGGADALMGTVDLGSLPEDAFLPNPESGAEVATAEPGPVLAADAIPPLAACLNANDFEAVARRFMSDRGDKKGWDYYISGGDDERTLRENSNVFQRVWLKPRILRNVSTVDMTASFLGCVCELPAYLSSVAMQKLGHEDGELAWIRACNNHGVIHMLPTMSSYSADDCFAECVALGQV